MVNEPTTIAYAIKEALKPVFVDSGNLVMRECAKHLGMKFVEFAQAAFMSELTGFFIEYLADQLFTYFGSGGGDTDTSFDFRALLEELLLFLPYSPTEPYFSQYGLPEYFSFHNCSSFSQIPHR